MDDISGRSHDDVDINQSMELLLVAYKIILPRQFLHPMSPSSMCVYTKDNASLQSTYLIMLVLLVTLFSSYDTHVSRHVMFYIMACHCII